jgi:hemoglobin/transferrin/lactoferrin receptor protein
MPVLPLLLVVPLLAADAGGVLIHGDRSAERLAETPAAVQRKDRAAIDRAGHLDLAEALSTLPGVSLRERSPGSAMPVLRGLLGADNLVLIDGLRFTTGVFRDGPGGHLNSLGLYSFESMELVRGASAVPYGSGVIGGVLKLTSRDLERPDPHWWHWREFFGVQGESRYNFTSMVKRQGESVSSLLTVQRDKFRSRNHGGLYAGNPTFIPLSDHGQWDGLGKVRWKLGRYDLTLASVAMRVDGGGELDQISRGSIRRTRHRDALGWLRLNGRHTGLLRRSALWVGLRQGIQTLQSDRCDLLLGGERSCWERLDLSAGEEGFDAAGLIARRVDTDELFNVQAGAAVRLAPRPGLRLRLGAEWMSEAVTSAAAAEHGSLDLTPRFASGSATTTAGAYAHGVWRLARVEGARALQLSGGARLAFFGVRGAVDREWLAPVADVALSLVQKGRAATWLAYSRGFRAPTLRELVFEGDSGPWHERTSLGLEAQRSHTLEFGTKRRTARWRYDFSTFLLAVSDLIDEAPVAGAERDGGPVIERVNRTYGRFVGGDLLIRRDGETVVHQHQIGVVHGDVMTAGGEVIPARRAAPVRGRHVLGIKTYGAKLYSSLVLDWASAMGEARLHPADAIDLRVCAQPNDPGLTFAQSGLACPGTAAWWMLGARVVLQRKKSLRTGLRVDNLFDRLYRTHGSGTLAAGTTYRLDVEVKF